MPTPQSLGAPADGWLLAEWNSQSSISAGVIRRAAVPLSAHRRLRDIRRTQQQVNERLLAGRSPGGDKRPPALGPWWPPSQSRHCLSPLPPTCLRLRSVSWRSPCGRLPPGYRAVPPLSSLPACAWLLGRLVVELVAGDLLVLSERLLAGAESWGPLVIAQRCGDDHSVAPGSMNRRTGGALALLRADGDRLCGLSATRGSGGT